MTTPLTLSELNFSNLLKRSWAIVKANFVFLAGSFLAILVLQGILTALLGEIGTNSESAAGIFNLLMNIVAQIIAIGWMNVMLRATRNQELEVSNFFEKIGVFIKYLLTSLVVGLLVLLGFILLIIPGIYLALKYSFAHIAVVDKGVGPFEAMGMSSKMTKGVKGKLFLYWLGFVGVNILGLLALVVGLAITAPVTSIASVVLYNALLEKVEGEVSPKAAMQAADAAQTAEIERPPQSL